jgi:hypothetical protein
MQKIHNFKEKADWESYNMVTNKLDYSISRNITLSVFIYPPFWL